jgi:hypothetical protein
LIPATIRPPFLLSGAGLAALAAGAQSLARERSGDKVLRLPDGRILKLFRIKRLLSLSLLAPPAFRFRRNARGLARLGIPAPQVERLFFCPAARRYGVIYPQLVGQLLSQVAGASPQDLALWQDVAAFITTLHAKGVYFRSLHPDNILRLPDGGFGLIDVADLRLFKGPLSLSQRARNLRHLVRREEHRRLLDGIGLPQLLDIYAAASGLDPTQTARLHGWMGGKAKGRGLPEGEGKTMHPGTTR